VGGPEFLDALQRLIGVDETTRYLRKICPKHALDDMFHGEMTNAEALAFYVYSTANGWHTYINEQLWSGEPAPEVRAFAKMLNSGLNKIVAIAGSQGTVYRGYSVTNLEAFAAHYVQGEIVRFPAFTSASFAESGAFGGNVLFIIRALSSRAIWWLTPNFHEEEALLPTDCVFRIVDREFQSVGGKPVKLVVVLQEIKEA
jgi:hypothetical protein